MIYWRVYRGKRRRCRLIIYSHTRVGMRGRRWESCYYQWRRRERQRGEPASRMWDFIDHE